MIKTFANRFRNANEAFEYWYQCIEHYGTEFDGTKALFNIGFQIDDPKNRVITHEFRNWKVDYAFAEWQWYLTGDPNVKMLESLYGKVPEIWKRMTNDHGDVNSNYGYQWGRHHQLDYTIEKLRRNPNTRQAAISIYDCKEHHLYKNDTPCTYAVQFTIVNNRLNMCVTMRSNDLWYGFCNDQYCFSQLQELVAEELDIEMGSYYHFAHNLHLYTKNQGKWPRKSNNVAQRKADYYG